MPVIADLQVWWVPAWITDEEGAHHFVVLVFDDVTVPDI
jgi:hypothetical protein